jgi:glutaredoxin
VTVYTRANCELCAEAERTVARVATGRAEVVTVDIDADAELFERYTVRVPVVAVDGEEVFDFEVDPPALRQALRTARKAHR